LGRGRNVIAVLDANTIIFLAFMNLDAFKCLEYLNKIFQTIIITPEVFDEVFKNRHNKFSKYSYLEVDDLDEFVDHYKKELRQFIRNDDTSEIQKFVKKHTNYFKDKKGEFFSTAFALQCSRYEGDNFNEYLLKTFIITDDEDAIKDFEEFYNNNLIGRFLSTIDLFTIFYIHDLISKTDYQKSFHSLKYLYSEPLYQCIIEIKKLKEQLADSPKDQLLLSQLLETLEKMNYEEANNLVQRRELKRNLKDKLKLLEDLFRGNNSSKKISNINDKLSKIDKIYRVEFS